MPIITLGRRRPDHGIHIRTLATITTAATILQFASNENEKKDDQEGKTETEIQESIVNHLLF